jgi:hypothetical protein
VSADPWEEGTFAGLERAQRRRVAAWTPQERLAWLEAVVLEAHRAGVLDDLRARKQRAVMAAWQA